MKLQWVYFSDFKPIELYRVLQLRGKVFAVEQNEAYLDADDKDIDAWHLLAWDDEQLIGYARLIPPVNTSDPVILGRGCVAATYRKQGIGEKIFDELLSWISQNYSDSKIIISAQIYLVPSYEARGFKSFGEIFYAGKLPHIQMEHMPLKDSLSLKK